MFQDIVASEAKLYCTRFEDGTTIIYRILTLKELSRIDIYKEISEEEDSVLYEEIYNMCAITPYKNIGGAIRAGVPQSIGAFIYYLSSSTDEIELEILASRKKYANSELISFTEDMKRVISTAFPSYTLDILDKKSKTELIDLFTRSESLLEFRTKGEYKPINLKALRKPIQNSNIDFAKENKEIAKAGYGVEDTPWGRNGNAHELKQIREQAAVKANRRR